MAIESRQSAIEAQIADLQTAQQNILARLTQVRQELDNSLQPLRTQSADRGEDMRSMVRQVTALEDQIAQMDERISRLTEQLAAGTGAPSRSPETGVAMPPPRGARAQVGTNAPEPAADSPATRLYNDAFNDYLRENYGLCVQGFQEYIRQYATSDRADDAQYWIGECQASGGNTRAAREAFQELLQRYPGSDKIPDALLRDALILKEEGQGGAAGEAFRRLIQAYPASDAAFLACGQLESMGFEAPAVCREIRG